MQSEQSNSEGEGFTVLMTGASGYIAGHIIQELLQRGYTVRGSVRGEPCSSNYGYLFGLSGAKERLTLVTLDLTQSQGFDDAVRGCDFVIHAAQPMPDQHSDEDLISITEDALCHLLKACLKESRLQRIVYTSSQSACNSNRWNDSNSQGRPCLLTAQEWTPSQNSDFYVSAYGSTKVRCERMLYEWQSRDPVPHFDFCTILPASVFGPWLNPNRVPLSVSASLTDFLTWKQKIGLVLPKQFSLVDVRDVAAMHVNALCPLSRVHCDQVLSKIRGSMNKESKHKECDSSALSSAAKKRRLRTSGKRYLVCGEMLWHRDMFALIRSEFGHRLETPTVEMPVWIVDILALFNPLVRDFLQRLAGSKRFCDITPTSRDLGFVPTPSQVTLIDTVQCAFFSEHSTLTPRFVDLVGRFLTFVKLVLFVGVMSFFIGIFIS